MLIRKLKEEKGQIFPFIAIATVMLLVIIAFIVSTSVMFLERKALEDAVDAAVLSAAMGAAEEEFRHTLYLDDLYGDYDICDIETWEIYCGGCFDEEGNLLCGGDCVVGIYTLFHITRWNEPREYELHEANYIHVDRNRAYDIAMQYLETNLYASGSNATVENLYLEFEYDDERFLEVTKIMNYLNPIAGSVGQWGSTKFGRRPLPSGPDTGVTNCTCCEQYTVRGTTDNPPNWWFEEFGGNEGFDEYDYWFHEDMKEWTYDSYEPRQIRFPRWVEITAVAEFEVPILMGSLALREADLGAHTVTMEVRASAVRELLQVRDP